MALQTITTIKIGETVIKNFSHLKIDQKIHDHHTFSIELRQDLLVSELQSVMPASQELFGEKISIEIKPLPGLDDLMITNNPKDYILQFYGIVTKIRLIKSRIKDIEETILIEGHSRSIILDNGPQSNSFTKMPIADIVNKVKSGYDIDMEIQPFFTAILAYTVQYNESDFDFLNRLAKRYGLWFFDNGLKIVLGGPGGRVIPKLAYGINMYDFDYQMKLIPSLFKVIENDHTSGEFITDNPINYRKETDVAHQNFVNKSNQVFSKETTIQLNQNSTDGNGKNSLEEYSKNKMRASVSKMMQVTGSSEVPGITVGSDVSITGVDKWLESHYTITQVTHSCDDGGDYENHFTAINFSGSVFSPETNPDLIPVCKSQTAVVIANADPDGLSGVQVQMPWQEDKGETTPYIPLLQKYGGDGRGSHILPEIGDTVFVDFQGDNAELPIVIGTMTNRKETSGYSTADNDLKVMRTRSGIIIILNDADGSVLIEDPSGNKYFMDGSGNIKFLAPNTIEIEAGEDIIMKAGRDIDIEANRNIRQIAEQDIDITAKGNISEFGDNKSENITNNYVRSSGESTQFAEEVKIISTHENMLLESSQKTVEINSAEKSNIF